MKKKTYKIAFFGSSLVSAYWNGAATYYRGLIRELAKLGHAITFYEPDAFERQSHRDIEDPEWARVVVYENDAKAAMTCVREAAADADVLVKASGVGVFDEMLEKAIVEARGPQQKAIFWDVDAPATLSRLRENPEDPFHRHLPAYDLVLTYGGGEPVVQQYEKMGARRCIPVYNALDATTHFPVEPEAKFRGDLAFLGNRLPDREKRVEEFFLYPASLLPGSQFLIGGSGWGDKDMPENIHYLGHVYTKDHNAFNCSPRFVLNISRNSMATNGFSPATRVFEAAGAGACLITDYWEGISLFLEPGEEVLVARDGREVATIMQTISTEKAAAIGEAARQRVLREHTYAHRAMQVEEILRKPEAKMQKSKVGSKDSWSPGSKDSLSESRTRDGVHRRKTPAPPNNGTR